MQLQTSKQIAEIDELDADGDVSPSGFGASKTFGLGRTGGMLGSM